MRTAAPRASTTRRRLAPALALVLAATVAVSALTLSPPLTPGAAAETTALPGELALGGPTPVSVRVAVPPGVLPTALTGHLTVVGSVDDDVSVLVGDRVAATVPAETADLTIPVSRDDVVGGVLGLSLRFSSPDSCPPPAESPLATLSDLALESAGVELAPGGSGDFWPLFSSRIDVVVPGRADDALLEVALNAVSALSRRYGPGTPVVLSSASTRLPRTGFGQRILRLAPGEGAVQATLTSRFALAELDLTGGTDDLRSAVRTLAYGNDLTAAVPENPAPALTRSFTDLGAESVSVGGPSGAVGMVRIPQDAFGEQVGGLRIRAEGSHTAMAQPSTSDEDAPTPTLDTYLNDVLIDSAPLDPDDPAVTVDAAVDASVLEPVNALRFAIGSDSENEDDSEDSEDPAGGGCAPAGAPTVSLDGGDGTVVATPGDGAEAGLAAYPQNLGGSLEVAVRPQGGLRVAAAADAAAVLSALQGAAAGLLDVTVVEADEFVAGGGSGLIAGADLDDADALSAPLQYEEVLDDSRPTPETDVDVTQLFAALESVSTGARDVLVLGAFGPGDRAAQSALRATTAKAAVTRGWNDLDGDVLVTTRDAGPTVVSMGDPVARRAADDPGSGLAGGWLAAAVAALLLLLGLQVRRGVLQDRRTRDAADDVTA